MGTREQEALKKYLEAVKKRVEEKALRHRETFGYDPPLQPADWANFRKEAKAEVAGPRWAQQRGSLGATAAAAAIVARVLPPVTEVKKPKGVSVQLTTCWEKINALTNMIAHRISNGNPVGSINRLLLYGVPGTGKSRLGVMLAEMAGLQMWRQTLNPHAGAFDIIGMFSPTEKGMKYHLGNAMRAWGGGDTDGGGVWVADEIDKAGGDLEIALHAVLDDPANAALTLPTGQTLKPGKKFVCIATMNGDPSMLTPALRDRFPLKIEVDRPNPEAIKMLPEDLRLVAEGLCGNKDPLRRVGLRTWFALADLRKDMSEGDAGLLVFGEERWAQIQDDLKLHRA